MSRHYLLNAVRTRLMTELGYTTREVDVMPNGQPHPRAGKVFAAIHPGPYSDQGGGESLNEVYGLTVTVTLRVNEPFDRVGKDLLQRITQGMEDRVAAIREAVHQNYTTMGYANTALWAATARSVGGFVEPLRCTGVGVPSLVGSDWFHAKPGGECGLVCDIDFGQARRVQTIGSAS